MSVGITGKIGLKKERYHFTALYLEVKNSLIATTTTWE